MAESGLLDGKQTIKRKSNNQKKTVQKRRHEIISFPLKPPYGFILVPNGDDIYTYPKKFVDPLQSGDMNLFRQTMNTICSPEVELILEYDGEQNPIGPNNR